MKLAVTASIFHHIYQDPAGELGVRLSPEALANDSAVEQLLLDINQVYNAKPAKGYASFLSSDDPLYRAEQDVAESLAEPEFPRLLDAWLNEDMSFVEFSQQAARLLLQELSKYQFANSGYLLLADYADTGDRILFASFLPVREGVMVSPDLTVNSAPQLDVSKVQLAARVNLTEYAAAEPDLPYISFIKGRAGRRISDFFLDFLGCAERVNAKTQTEELVKQVNAFVQQEEIPQDEARTVRKDVYDYCGEQFQQNEPVQLNALDERLSESTGKSFREFNQTQEQGLPESFPADRTSLRRLVKFQGQGGGLSVGFDQEMLGERVDYDPDTDTLTIKGTPPNLRDQLQRFYGR